MRVARPVILNPEQRRQLEQVSRARSAPARQVDRARVVLRAADGWPDKQIAAEFGITPEKAARWRNRFLDGGFAALQKDAPRPGRPHTVPAEKVQQIVHKTTQEKPDAATHWSTRTMAAAVGVSAATVRGSGVPTASNLICLRHLRSATTHSLPKSWRPLSGSTSIRRSMPWYFAWTKRARFKRSIGRNQGFP